MKLFRFIFHSYIFRQVVIATISFIIVLLIVSISFDEFWGYTGLFPVPNIEDFYQIPKSYDDISRINIKLIDKEKIAIECNKEFRIFKDSFDYYDTVKIEKPDSINSVTTKIFIHYENPESSDSVYFVFSKSDKPDIFWNQIFYSSVIVSRLNNFSEDTEEFRIDKQQLVSSRLLADNDTLINEAINYFNVNSKDLDLAECGTNSRIFGTICDRFQLPCRIIKLQGGDALNEGYDDQLGYPLHVLCEVYSSKYRKWMVIDPTYGSIYRLDSEPLNAIEISNRVFFQSAKNIFQDSVMVTRKTTLGNDYFKYYENVYFFSTNLHLNFVLNKFLGIFYRHFYYESSLYTHNLNFFKNGLNYLSIKSIVLFIVSLIYFYIILIFISRRLLLAKWKR